MGEHTQQGQGPRGSGSPARTRPTTGDCTQPGGQRASAPKHRDSRMSRVFNYLRNPRGCGTRAPQCAAPKLALSHFESVICRLSSRSRKVCGSTKVFHFVPSTSRAFPHALVSPARRIPSPGAATKRGFPQPGRPPWRSQPRPSRSPERERRVVKPPRPRLPSRHERVSSLSGGDCYPVLVAYFGWPTLPRPNQRSWPAYRQYTVPDIRRLQTKE